MTTPIAVDALNAVLTEMFSDIDRIKIKTSHSSMWRKPNSEDVTDIIENADQFSYDIIRGTDTISDVHPKTQIEGEFNIGSNAVLNTEEIFQNVSNVFPIMYEDSAVSFNQTLKRLAGQLGVTKMSMSDMSSFEKAAILLARGIKTGIRKMSGKMNLIASEAIRTAKITLSDSSQYDFDRATGNTINVGITWDNVSTATPIANLARLYEAVRDNGRVTPWFVGMGSTAASSFFATNEITALSDLRRANFISAGRDLPALPEGGQRMVDNGWVYQAFLLTPEGYSLFIFVNNDNFQLQNKTFTTYQPLKDVLMMDPSLRTDWFFGPDVRFPLITPVDQMINRVFGINNMTSSMPPSVGTNIIESWMFRHKTFVNEGETSIGVKSYSSSLPIPTQVDAAGTLPNVTA